LKRQSPFGDLSAALARSDRVIEELGARVDPNRLLRTGVPEVVYCPGKTVLQIAGIVRRLAEKSGRALAARCQAELACELIDFLVADAIAAEFDPVSRTIVAAMPGAEVAMTGGRVGLLTAGSSDWPAASEAAVLVREMGCTVQAFQDVGVAGIHRLVDPLEQLAESDVDVVLVAAGMDGALPSVVAGLVNVPVVGLPTSTGYGFGGNGIGALSTMLQSCSPGLAVVNIDNGIGAGAMAGLIANRVAEARRLRAVSQDPLPQSNE
jgi:pyridinium-3,5-biscarboxylic acid mononucleotide synthase